MENNNNEDTNLSLFNAYDYIIEHIDRIQVREADTGKKYNLDWVNLDESGDIVLSIEKNDE